MTNSQENKSFMSPEFREAFIQRAIGEKYRNRSQCRGMGPCDVPVDTATIAILPASPDILSRWDSEIDNDDFEAMCTRTRFVTKSGETFTQGTDFFHRYQKLGNTGLSANQMLENPDITKEVIPQGDLRREFGAAAAAQASMNEEGRGTISLDGTPRGFAQRTCYGDGLYTLESQEVEPYEDKPPHENHMMITGSTRGGIKASVTGKIKTNGAPLYICDPSYLTKSGFCMKPVLIENPLTDSDGITAIYKLTEDNSGREIGFMVKSNIGNIKAFHAAANTKPETTKTNDTEDFPITAAFAR